MPFLGKQLAIKLNFCKPAKRASIFGSKGAVQSAKLGFVSKWAQTGCCPCSFRFPAKTIQKGSLRQATPIWSGLQLLGQRLPALGRQLGFQHPKRQVAEAVHIGVAEVQLLDEGEAGEVAEERARLGTRQYLPQLLLLP